MSSGRSEKGSIQTLHLPSKKQGPLPVEVDAIHVRLPCRLFRASYKVAESGRFTLTTEFLLRLLLAAGDLLEVEASEFFGYEQDEAQHAIEAAVSQGYVDRLTGGRIQLSAAGRATFEAGKGRPHIYEMHEREDNFVLDMLSFSPATSPWMTPFETALPELSVIETSQISDATTKAREAFKRHFRDLNLRKSEDLDTSRSLYSIDNIRSLKRTECVVPVSVRMRSDGTGSVEPDLSSWITGTDLDQRAAVVSSAAALLSVIEQPPARALSAAVEVLVKIAPEQMKGFVTLEGFDTAHYFRRAAAQTGDVQVNRKTVRAVGTLWTTGTAAKLQSAGRLAHREGANWPSAAIWLAPSTTIWGSSNRFPNLLNEVLRDVIAEKAENASENTDSSFRLRTVAISGPLARPMERRLKAAVDALLEMPRDVVPPGLELLLIPGNIAVAMVMAPVGSGRGYPVALGVVSADASVVNRVQATLLDFIDQAKNGSVANSEKLSLLDEVENLLQPTI